MPDGTIIKNVPDNITQSELSARYQAFSAPQAAQVPFTGQIPEGVDVRDFSVNPEAVPAQAPAGPRNFHERLFGKPGTPLLPGAEPLKWAAENPEVVGATVASLLAPEVAAPAAIAKFGPAASQIFSQTAARVPAAFMGGAGGNLVGQMTGSKKVDPNAEISDIILDNLKAGGRMAAAEATGAMLSPVVTKVFAPGASSLTPEGEKIRQFAQENRVPLAPSTVSPNLSAKTTEGATDAFLPSRLVNDHYRKKTIQRFNELMTEIPEQVAPLPGNQLATQDMVNELKTLYATREMAGKKLASEFLDSVGRNTEIPVDSTLTVLKSINKSAVDPALRDFATTKLQQLDGPVTAADLETALRQIGGIKPKSDTKFLEMLRNAIKSDFANAGAPVEKLAESNQAFKENIGLLAGQASKQLKAMIAKGEEPAFLTAKIFRSGNEGFIKSLASEAEKGNISKEVWDGLRAQNLQNMIQNSTVESQRLMGLRILDGAKLEKILTTNKTALDVAYKDNPKVLEAIGNLARLAKASRPDLQVFEKGIGDFTKTANLGGIATALVTHPVGIIVGSGTSAALASSMMNPSGIVNRYLTTGFGEGMAHNTAQEGLRLGGRLVFKEE